MDGGLLWSVYAKVFEGENEDACLTWLASAGNVDVSEALRTGRVKIVGRIPESLDTEDSRPVE